jgi:undecaprenyl phosphate N,N'-diacetylbacillosamine 1-phosphate transferase
LRIFGASKLLRKFQLSLKRIFDIGVSVFGLLFLIPVFALIALSVCLDSAGSVLFRLRSAGQDGKAFDQWKFRTMVQNARDATHRFETSSTDPRITRVGRFLRRWSLDELPQLWNVLRGEMSVVGPRPTFIEIAAAYSPVQAQRLRMRPGLTGLAQLQGRNLVPWQQRVILDIAYIDHYSLWLDFKILLRTIPVLLRGTGIYGADGTVKMHDLA